MKKIYVLQTYHQRTDKDGTKIWYETRVEYYGKLKDASDMVINMMEVNKATEIVDIIKDKPSEDWDNHNVLIRYKTETYDNNVIEVRHSVMEKPVL